jgi:uncharacterized SAM-binding protein YcdF (DUF218 family)
MVRRRGGIKYYLLIFLLLGVALVPFAPGYLSYQDPVRQSDSVILFVGAGSTVREDKARELIARGFSQHLIVPKYGNFFRSTGNGQWELVRRVPLVSSGEKSRADVLPNHKFYENTHLEMLMARRIMDELGFKTAILVSEPYHMRRIKLIADRVFDEEAYRLRFIPTSPGGNDRLWWLLYKDKRRWIVSEYIKILWFVLYAPFTQ